MFLSARRALKQERGASSAAFVRDNRNACDPDWERLSFVTDPQAPRPGPAERKRLMTLPILLYQPLWRQSREPSTASPGKAGLGVQMPKLYSALLFASREKGKGCELLGCPGRTYGHRWKCRQYMGLAGNETGS